MLLSVVTVVLYLYIAFDQQQQLRQAIRGKAPGVAASSRSQAKITRMLGFVLGLYFAFPGGPLPTKMVPYVWE